MKNELVPDREYDYFLDQRLLSVPRLITKELYQHLIVPSLIETGFVTTSGGNYQIKPPFTVDSLVYLKNGCLHAAYQFVSIIPLLDNWHWVDQDHVTYQILKPFKKVVFNGQYSPKPATLQFHFPGAENFLRSIEVAGSELEPLGFNENKNPFFCRWVYNTKFRALIRPPDDADDFFFPAPKIWFSNLRHGRVSTLPLH